MDKFKFTKISGNFFKRGDSYYFYGQDEGRRIVKTLGTNQKVALAVYNKMLGELAEHRYLTVKKEPKVTFREFSEKFLTLHSIPNKKSSRRDKGIIKILSESFGNGQMGKITSLAIEEYKADRAKQVSYATVNKELSLLKTMFNKGISWGMVTANPVTAGRVQMFKVDNERVRYLTKPEIEKLLRNCHGKLRQIVIVAVNTGMRKGELQNLKWRDADFNKGLITLLETKSGKKRHIPMNDACRATLISVPKHEDSEYIFCGKNGRPYNFRRAFETSLKKCGISDFRFHDLRHTFASYLVMSGVDLNTVRELLGHADLKMTLRYAHLSADHKSRAVSVLSGITEEKSATEMRQLTQSDETS